MEIAPEKLDVIKFQERCNPLRDNCWDLDIPITQKDIEAAVHANNILPPESVNRNGNNRSNHIARIAWFVVYGWNDPISVDMGVPSLGCYPQWPLEDGNHRFAAAIVRGDYVIHVNMSGAISEIQAFLFEDFKGEL